MYFVYEIILTDRVIKDLELIDIKEKQRIAAVLLALPLFFYLTHQAIMLQWETVDYHLRGRLHEQVAAMYTQIKEKIPPAKPIIFVDLGKRQAVFEMAAAVKGYKKLLFERKKAIWQQVFLPPLANFLGKPFSKLMIPFEKNDLLPALKGEATILVFTDQGFAVSHVCVLQSSSLTPRRYPAAISRRPGYGNRPNLIHCSRAVR